MEAAPAPLGGPRVGVRAHADSSQKGTTLAKGKETLSLTQRVQELADAHFGALRLILIGDRDIQRMDQAVQLDANGEVMPLKMRVNIQSGAVTVWKGQERKVVQLRNLHLDHERMTAAETLLSELGVLITQVDGGDKIQTWNRLGQAAQGKVATLTPRSQELFRRKSPVDPIRMGQELNTQMGKDLAKCVGKDHAHRYIKMMRYGAVMMHEYKAGMELLLERYRGEKADLEAKKTEIGDKTSVEYLQLEYRIKKIEEKISAIESKMAEIDALDGYALSKMALHLASVEPDQLTEGKRKELAEACQRDIAEETAPEGVVATIKRKVGKSVEPSIDAAVYAKTVARSLLSDEQRATSGEFQGDLPLITQLVFAPAMAYHINPQRAYYGSANTTFMSELGEEVEAYMSEVHSTAMMTAYVAAEDPELEAYFSHDESSGRLFLHEGELHYIGANGICKSDGTKVGDFALLARYAPFSVAALEDDLTFAEDGKPGRYADRRFMEQSIRSLSQQLFRLRLNYYQKTATASFRNLDEQQQIIQIKLYPARYRTINYAKKSDQRATALNTRISVRPKDDPSRLSHVPPLRIYGFVSDTDEPANPVLHYSQFDRLQEGDQWIHPVTGAIYDATYPIDHLLEALEGHKPGILADDIPCVVPRPPRDPLMAGTDILSLVEIGVEEPDGIEGALARGRGSSLVEVGSGDIDGLELLDP